MSEQHLEPEVVARLASGALRGLERAAALAHAEACDSCRADLSYVIRFERHRRRRRQALVLAGGLGVAALAVTLMPAAPIVEGGPRVVRGGEEGIPNVVSYLPLDGSMVAGDSILFAWQDMGAGTHYTFLLSTAEGSPILERAVRDSTLYLARTDLLEPGGDYLWLVDALLADGSAATSAVWRFSARP